MCSSEKPPTFVGGFSFSVYLVRMFKHSLSLTFLLLTFCNLLVLGQVDSITVEKVSIINAKHKVEGIYRTFDEFRRNEPFYTDTFTIIPAGDATGTKNEAKRFISQHSFSQGYVDHVDIDGKPKPTRNGFTGQRFFGYCRGDNLYIGFWRFHRIDDFGHLSLIRVVEYRYHQSAPSSSPGFGGSAINFPGGGMEFLFKKWFVLDYMTGELYAINTFSLLDKFEKWDKELYKEYRKTKGRNKLEVQLEFVRKFNQRNPIRF